MGSHFPRKLTKRAITLGSLAVIFVIGYFSIAPPLIRRQLIHAIDRSCPDCRLRIESVKLSLLPARIRAHNVRFSYVDEKGTRVDLKARDVTASVVARSIFSRLKRIRSIDVSAPEVMLTEGLPARAGRASPGESGQGRGSAIEIERIAISDGRFVYRRRVRGQNADLRFDDIVAESSAIATDPSLVRLSIRASARARLEGSGEVQLAIHVTSLKPVRAEIRTEIRHQDLERVSSFFHTWNGIDFRGRIDVARVEEHVAGDRELVDETLTYDGLDVHFKKNDERSAISAFLQNLGSDIKLKSQDLDQPPEKRQARIDRERKPDESLVSFILQGMKEAALKVASS